MLHGSGNHLAESLFDDFIQQRIFILVMSVKCGAVNGSSLCDIFDGDCIEASQPQQLTEGFSDQLPCAHNPWIYLVNHR